MEPHRLSTAGSWREEILAGLTAARALTISATAQGVIGWLPTWGGEGGSPARAYRGSQVYRVVRDFPAILGGPPAAP